MNKVSYLLKTIANYNTEITCPSCHSDRAKLIDKKYLFLRLFECESCKLYYRHPTEKVIENEKFYQEAYSEKGDSLTTYMPNENELLELKQKSFNSGSDRSIERLLPIFKACFPNLKGTKIVDYGTSWGYISYQLKQIGMDVQSYEISKPRAKYGNDNLDLNIVSNISELKNRNDIFFSSHVIEHVPSPSKMIDIGKKLLHQDGVYISICPNGSPEFRAKRPKNFHRGWGQVHPNYLNAAFFQNYFKNNPYYICSYPFNYKGIQGWENEQFVDDLSGNELLVLSKPNTEI